MQAEMIAKKHFLLWSSYSPTELVGHFLHTVHKHGYGLKQMMKFSKMIETFA